MWVKTPGTDFGRGYKTGYCTHSTIGRITRSTDTCMFFVKGKLDENVSLEAFEDLRAGIVRPKHAYSAGPRVVDTDLFRKRSGGL